MYKPIDIKNMYINISFDNLQLRVYTLGGGKFNQDTEMHTHGKYFYELHLICEGKGHLNADSFSGDLRKGHMFMTGSQISHEQLTDPEDNMVEYCLGFNIEKKKNKPDTERSKLLQDTYFWFGEDNGTVEWYFEKIADEFSKRQYGYKEIVENIIMLIILELIRKYKGKNIIGEKMYSSADNMRMRLIEKRFRDDYVYVTEDNLSDELHLSRRQLLRFLKQQYGKTFRKMKKDAVMTAADRMIKKGKSVKDTAAAVGYVDLQSFKKAYNEYTNHIN